MAIVDKMQKLQSGIINFLDADDNILFQENAANLGTKLNANQSALYITKGEKILFNTADITRLQYYPAANAAFAGNAAALAAELAANFLGDKYNSAILSTIATNTTP